MVMEKSNSEDLFTEKYPMENCCIIPAAGLSSRMGCWKGELKTRDGISFIENAVSTAQMVCSKVIVVGGYRFTDLEALLARFSGIHILYNPDFKRGMLSSIQKGLEAVYNDFFVFPMDMPLIGDDVFFNLKRVSVSC